MATALTNAILKNNSILIYWAGMFIVNIIIAFIALEIARRVSTAQRARLEGRKGAAAA